MTAKRIFVACPIGDDTSDERKRSDRLLKYVIAPVVQDVMNTNPDEVVLRADRIAAPGRITKQVITEIAACDVMIADVTGDDPNVMYEIGLRQALLRPYILMAEKGHRLPFDLADIRTIFYELDLDTVQRAKGELKPYLERALRSEISPIDQELLGSRSGSAATETTVAPANVQVLEASSKILEELRSVRELLANVGGVVLEVRDRDRRELQQRQEQFNQQLGIAFVEQLLKNPEALDKTLPAIQKLMEFAMQMQKSRLDQPQTANLQQLPRETDSK
jgi:hypothetical protein